MLASTIILLVAFPLYRLGYHWYGAAGLALASDAGIALQAISLAVLLHQRRMVSLASLDYAEMGRCLLTAVVSGAGVGVVFGWLGNVLHKAVPSQTRGIDLAVLVAGTVVWVTLANLVLEKTGSALPRVTKKRLGLG
jgi:putative peptidoglycan lipid II flippase